MIILDMGSGNGKGNSVDYVEQSIDAIKEVDSGKHEIVLKWQLFKHAPPNVPLNHDAFKRAYEYGTELGYKVTASVFDLDSLNFLLDFDVPFVKIANMPDLYPMAAFIPHSIIVVSYSSTAEMGKRRAVKPLCCVSKYPATIEEYEKNFNRKWLSKGISDHTVGFELYNKYNPEIWEKHFILKRSKGNPDAGTFAVTPKDLEVIL